MLSLEATRADVEATRATVEARLLELARDKEAYTNARATANFAAQNAISTGDRVASVLSAYMIACTARDAAYAVADAAAAANYQDNFAIMTLYGVAEFTQRFHPVTDPVPEYRVAQAAWAAASKVYSNINSLYCAANDEDKTVSQCVWVINFDHRRRIKEAVWEVRAIETMRAIEVIEPMRAAEAAHSKFRDTYMLCRIATEYVGKAVGAAAKAASDAADAVRGET